MTTTLCTPEDQAAWDALTAQIRALNTDVARIERERKTIAARTFAQFLRTGRWKIDGFRLEPVDRVADEQISAMMGTALKLEYHGSFTVYDGRIKIYGQIHDGELTLDVYPARMCDAPDADEARTAFREIQVDVDLAEWAEDLRVKALEKARRELRDIQARIKKLEIPASDTP